MICSAAGAGIKLLVAIIDAEAAARFPQNHLRGPVLSGTDALCEMVQAAKGDVVVIATAGAAGFRPTFEAIRQRKHIALANKEFWRWQQPARKEARKYQVPTFRSIVNTARLQCLQSDSMKRCIKHPDRWRSLSRKPLKSSGVSVRGTHPPGPWVLRSLLIPPLCSTRV